MSRRLTTRLRDVLPSVLLPAYDEQWGVLAAYVGPPDMEEGRQRLQAIVLQTLVEGYGMSQAEATALDQLARLLPPASAAVTGGEAYLERAALQRALLAVGWGGALVPYWRAAAAGALAGASVGDADVVLADPAALEAAAKRAAAALDAYLPVLNARPTVDLSRVGAGPSRLFTPPEGS